MEDPFKNLEKDLTHILRAAVDGAGDTPPRNQGGAPLGNQNARTHGFYSKSLTQEQQESLVEARKADILAEEIATLRVKLAALLDDPKVDPNLLLRAYWTLARIVRIDDNLRFGP